MTSLLMGDPTGFASICGAREAGNMDKDQATDPSRRTDTDSKPLNAGLRPKDHLRTGELAGTGSSLT